MNIDNLDTASVRNDPIISASGIVKNFGSVTAVDGVSFDVYKGETYGLLGPNGAGKTTTMRLLSALSPLTAGTLTVAGLDVSTMGREVRDVLGVVTQEDGLDTDLTPTRQPDCLRIPCRAQVLGRCAKSGRSAAVLRSH